MRISRALLIASLLCTTLSILGCGGAKSQLASHMRRGQQFFQSGEFAKASVEFRNAMQIAPKDAQARVMAAQAAEKLGQLRNAYGLLQSVVDEHPDDIGARTALGRLLITAGDPKQGIQILKPAVIKRPNDATLLALQGAGEAALKDNAAARADADRAVALDPQNEDAVGLRAGLYKQDGDLPAAIKLVSAASVAHPDIAGFHQVLVSLYEATQQPQQAEGQLRALVKLKPAELSYRAQLAVFLSQTKRLDDAQKVLDEAVKALPSSDQAKLLDVDFLAQQRTHYAAEQALRDFIKTDSKNYSLQLALGSMLQQFGENAKAITVFSDIVKSAGTQANGLIARDRLAVIAVAEKRDADAQGLIAEVLKVSPRDNQALALRGQMELARGDSTSAIADFRAVLRDQPRNSGINRQLAQALVTHGDTALAEEPLRTAVEASPGDASLRISLAQLLFQLKQQEQGLTVLKDGIKQAPADKALNDALVRADLARKDVAAATRAVDDYRQVKPDDPAPYLLAGLIAQIDNRPLDAQAQYERALAIQPHGYDVLSQLVHLQVQQGQGAKAVSRLQAVIAAEPNSGLIKNLLGEIYLEQRNFVSAQQVLMTAIADSPKWWMPYRNLALAKYGAGDTAGAIDAYQSGLKLAPDDGTMLTDLGSLYQRSGRVDEAQKLYDGWLARDPRSQVAANNLAMLLVSYHTDKASLDRAQLLTVGFASAGNADLLDTAGWVQFKRGDYGQALPVLQRAAALMPQSREVHYHLGMAELRSGQTDRARTDLETALAGSARFSGEEDARAALATLMGRAT